MIDFNKFKFKKNFGQNFIFDNALLWQIIEKSKVGKGDNILEIGAGAGTLTEKLAKSAKKVVAYEIDKTLTEHLNLLSEKHSNLSIYMKDALKTSIKEIETDFNDEKYSIVANIPYYITSPLVFKFIEETKNAESITVMVQKEVAERYCAKPGSKNYGISTVMLNYYADIEYLMTIDRTFFNPSPKVDSALIKITPNKKFEVKNEKNFKKLINSAFSMKRKTLINNLVKSYSISKENIINLLKQLNKPESVRAEELSLSDFIFLSDNL